MKKQIIAMAVAAAVAIGTVAAQEPARKDRPVRPTPQSGKLERVSPEDGKAPLRHGPQDGKHHGPQGPEKMRPKTIGRNADGISLDIVYFFPEAKSVKKGEKNTQVLDAKGNLLGYVAYSTPENKDIVGHGGTTPVMVAVNKQKVVLGVYMLPNLESPNYLDRIEQAGFLNHWNGLKLKDAKKKKVDTISGATKTTSALLKNVAIAFDKL